MALQHLQHSKVNGYPQCASFPVVPMPPLLFALLRTEVTDTACNQLPVGAALGTDLKRRRFGIKLALKDETSINIMQNHAYLP